MRTLFTERAPAGMIEEHVGIVADFHPADVRSMLRSMAGAIRERGRSRATDARGEASYSG